MKEDPREKLAQALHGVLRFEPQLDVIMRICTFAEAQEETSGLHIHRLAAFCLEIGSAFNLGEVANRKLAVGAVLHDIGKLSIPGRIIFKPGKLNPEEWEIMKTHTTAGAHILEGSSFPEVEEASQVALCHHEKWDGSGYPSGLVGDSIPFCARVVAVADVFDALTTRRPYKNAYPLDASLTVINEGAGVHFDPGVVKAFMSRKSRIRALLSLFEDVSKEIPLYKFTEFLEGRR